MENPSLNISLLCLAPKYLDLILWALSFGLHWRVDVHERASNHHGLRSFVRAFGLRLSSCHRVIVGLAISCSKIGQKPEKQSTSKIYVQTQKRPIIGPRLAWLVILILNSCHYQG